MSLSLSVLLDFTAYRWDDGLLQQLYVIHEARVLEYLVHCRPHLDVLQSLVKLFPCVFTFLLFEEIMNPFHFPVHFILGSDLQSWRPVNHLLLLHLYVNLHVLASLRKLLCQSWCSWERAREKGESHFIVRENIFIATTQNVGVSWPIRILQFLIIKSAHLVHFSPFSSSQLLCNHHLLTELWPMTSYYKEYGNSPTI